MSDSTTVKKDPIKPTYKSNKSPRKILLALQLLPPSLLSDYQSCPRLSPLARLDLSFLSCSVVTSPSSDLVLDPAGVHKAQQNFAIF
ncbi:hypothetical protein GH714_004674 [Hevea brasiliensis]|uniref:Uncharacterized protein n=1 Tax=Hevea brasiliensis TaxID=3981 RepID=A0A6A6N0W3_HEVBR|nr:hypothetical protein GH714_004674 [Hevea brasiliensis]